MNVINENIILITDKVNVRERIFAAIDAKVGHSNICGTPWSSQPRSSADFILNTFRPLFCDIKEGDRPSELFRERVRWIEMVPEVNIHGDLMEAFGVMGRDEKALLIIASAKVTESLLGTSVRRWYQEHSRRIEDSDEKRGMVLGEVGLPPRSPLKKVPDRRAMMTEVIVMPSSGRNPWGRAYFAEDGKFHGLWCDYLRRVHQALGCDRHAVW